MTTNEAAQILYRMYSTASRGDQVAQIHLFGIKYARDLDRLNIERVLEEAGMHNSYKTEINKARRLAKYVDVKSAYQ